MLYNNVYPANALSGFRHLHLSVAVAQHTLLLPASIWYLRSKRENPPLCAQLSIPDLRILVLCFALAAAPLSRLTTQGLLNPDESGYSFQAHVFLTGRLMAPPLPGAAANVRETPAEVFYENHILRPNGWFTKFPPGWPLVLAAGELVSSGWLVNPVLSVVLLFILAAIGRESFSNGVAFLSVLFAVLSPFYLVNSVGMMSHTLCAVLIALACLFLFRACDTHRLCYFSATFASLAAAFQVRPYTAFVITCVIAAAALWAVRDNRLLLKQVLLLGSFFGVLAAGGLFAYNRFYTGHALISPYALFLGRSAPPELTFHPIQILRSIERHGRQTVLENVIGVFPFLYLLAGYAVLHEKRVRFKVFVCAAVYSSLVLAYLAHIEAGGGGVFFGKRFHFEGLFAVLLLAARGLELMVENWEISLPKVARTVIVLSLMQVFLLGAAGWTIARSGRPYRQVKKALLKTTFRRMIFLHNSPGFVAKHLNLNRADWPHASQIYLIDAEPRQRSQWACRYGMSEWMVVTYNPMTQRADLENGQAHCSFAGVR